MPCEAHRHVFRSHPFGNALDPSDEKRRYWTGRFAHHPHADRRDRIDHAERRASEPLADQPLTAPPSGGLALIGDHSFSTGRRIATTTDMWEIRFDSGRVKRSKRWGS